MIVPFRQRSPAFWIGNTVYLVTCDEPERGIVTGVDFRAGHELFEVTWGTGGVTYHNDFELSAEFTPQFPENGDD